MTQAKFTKELFSAAPFPSHKLVVTPLPHSLKLNANGTSLRSDPTEYRSLVGKLNFLTHTRYDLSYTVQHLSQYMHSPREAHYQALHHILNYISFTAGQGILLKGSNSLTIQAFSDSD